MLTETHKKNWAGQHSELLYWTSNGQFKSKMNLPLEKVSKIPLGALTRRPCQENAYFMKVRLLKSYKNVRFKVLVIVLESFL